MKKICNIFLLGLCIGLLLTCCNTLFSQPVQRNPISCIAFDQVQVGGELLSRLTRNFNRLEEEKYRPAKVYLSEEQSGWWPGDTEGRTILGLTLDAQATGREPCYLDSIIALFPQKVNPKGYFGTIYPDSLFDEQQLSSHGWVLRGLCEYYLWKKDPEVLLYINRIINNLILPTKGFQSLYPIDTAGRRHEGKQIGNRINARRGNWILSTDIGCDFIFLDGVVQAYQVTQREELKPVIEEMIGRFKRIDLEAIKAQTHASLTGMRALLRYYQSTGDTSLLHQVEKDYTLYRTVARTENYENYNWFGLPKWTEPCAVVDSYILSVWLWMYTGNPLYLEDAHHIYYNALGFEQRANGGFGTNSCLGAGSPFLKVDLDEAHWCCTMRGGEGLSRVAQYSYFTGNESVYIPFFENSTVRLFFGKDSLVLQQKTDYPYQGKVLLKVIASSLTFTPDIYFFAPSWVSNPHLTLHGKPVKFTAGRDFIVCTRKLHTGDSIEYSFRIKSGEEPLDNPNSLKGYHKFYYGPLLLGKVGKEEIQLPRGLQFKPEGKVFKAINNSVMLTPVHHLLNKEVNKESGYMIQVLFKD